MASSVHSDGSSQVRAVNLTEPLVARRSPKATRVLGIDPGSRLTGYGLVDVERGELRYVASGCIDTSRGAFTSRLADIFHGVEAVIAEHNPDEFVIEEVFLARNPQSALKLGQARGVAIAAAVDAHLPVSEYAARSVKQAVVGTGRATKAQVQYMVRALLALSAEPAADAADALAVAICHVNTRGMNMDR